jgi:hypothetical protein
VYCSFKALANDKVPGLRQWFVFFAFTYVHLLFNCAVVIVLELLTQRPCVPQPTAQSVCLSRTQVGVLDRVWCVGHWGELSVLCVLRAHVQLPQVGPAHLLHAESGV